MASRTHQWEDDGREQALLNGYSRGHEWEANIGNKEVDQGEDGTDSADAALVAWYFTS